MPDAAKVIYDFGPFRLDTGERILLRDGRHVPLMPKTFETLLALVERQGHIVEKEDLMERVWPDAFVQEVNLFKNISDLRKILSGDGTKQYIETIPKRGYRFIAEVRQSWGEVDAPEHSNIILGGHQPEPVFGREAELAQLQSWLETALRGDRPSL
jgi:DNA-binding winged helix-turn-helix (wHTH) protein